MSHAFLILYRLDQEKEWISHSFQSALSLIFRFSSVIEKMGLAGYVRHVTPIGLTPMELISVLPRFHRRDWYDITSLAEPYKSLEIFSLTGCKY